MSAARRSLGLARALRVALVLVVGAAAAYTVVWGCVWGAGDTSVVRFGTHRPNSYDRVVLGGLPPVPDGPLAPGVATVIGSAVLVVLVVLLFIRAHRAESRRNGPR